MSQAMPVGFRTGLVLDPARRDWDDRGPRPCSWSAWYPAVEGSAETELSAGPPEAPWFRLGPVARSAPVATGAAPWPMVVLSHGTGGSALGLGWLGRRLAQRGFVAIGANHHGNWIGEPYRAEGFLCWWERAGDLSVLLDQLPAEPWLAGLVDPARALAAGFSLGSHTALALLGAVTDMSRFDNWAREHGLGRGPREFPDLADRFPELLRSSPVFRAAWERRADSWCDPRIAAALLLAPPCVVQAFHGPDLAEITAPVRIVAASADREAPPEDGALWLDEWLANSSLTTVQGAGHFVFLPEATAEGRRDATELCVDQEGVDRRAVHELAAGLGYDVALKGSSFSEEKEAKRLLSERAREGGTRTSPDG